MGASRHGQRRPGTRETGSIDDDPAETSSNGAAGEVAAGHVLDGHDILGVPLTGGVSEPSGAPGPDDQTDPTPLDGDASGDGRALGFDVAEPPDHGQGAEPWEQVGLDAWTAAGAADPGADHLDAVADPGPFGLDGSEDHSGLLDPGGRDLLEGPITDHNLDGIDDNVHLHGHG